MADMHAKATAFDRALGEELRAIRDRIPWTRDKAVDELRRVTGAVIGDRTLLTYEHGIRQLTVARLVELATAYGVPASTVLADALDRMETPPDPRCPTCGHAP